MSTTSSAAGDYIRRRFPWGNLFIMLKLFFRLNFTNALNQILTWKAAVSNAYNQLRDAQVKNDVVGTKNANDTLQQLLDNTLEKEVQALRAYGERLHDEALESASVVSELGSIAPTHSNTPIASKKISLEELKTTLLESRGELLTFDDLAKLQGNPPNSKHISDLERHVKEESVLYDRSERTNLKAAYRYAHVLKQAQKRFKELKAVTEKGAKKKMKFEDWFISNLKIKLSKGWMSKIFTVHGLCHKLPTLLTCSVGLKFIYEHRKEIQSLSSDTAFIQQLTYSADITL